MNERVKYPIVITVICVIAAAALAATYTVTKDPIAKSERSELEAGLKTVLPADRKSVEERTLVGGGDKLYVALDAAGKPVGYAAIGVARGYSSDIKALVGVNPEMQIVAVRILSQSETPGLGERTREVPPTKSIWSAIAGVFKGGEAEVEQEPPFQRQFRDKQLNQLVLTKDQGSKDRISQLTGATITSQAVVNAVRRAVETIEKATRTEGQKASESPSGVRPQPDL